ncbi:MAG TPA: hypothetical protein VMJ90_10605 [Anaerolineales bacterium]|nr:hypothetical protein [Anaerolineales bacterium]
MIDGAVQLPESLEVVQQAMVMIRDIESLLPASTHISFRERLVAQMEQESPDPVFLVKANSLLAFFEIHFGVNDFLDKSAEGTAGR